MLYSKEDVLGLKNESPNRPMAHFGKGRLWVYHLESLGNSCNILF